MRTRNYRDILENGSCLCVCIADTLIAVLRGKQIRTGHPFGCYIDFGKFSTVKFCFLFAGSTYIQCVILSVINLKCTAIMKNIGCTGRTAEAFTHDNRGVRTFKINKH